MDKLEVNSFLGCMKLETGSLIIGYLRLIIGVLGSIYGTFVLIVIFVWDCSALANYGIDGFLIEVEECIKMEPGQ